MREYVRTNNTYNAKLKYIRGHVADAREVVKDSGIYFCERLLFTEIRLLGLANDITSACAVLMN